MLISFYSVWHAVLPGSSSLLFGRRGSRAYQDVPKDSFDLHEGRNVSSGLLCQQETKLNLTLLSHFSIQELFRSFPSKDPIVRESTSLRSRGGLSRKRSSHLFAFYSKSSSLPSSSRTTMPPLERNSKLSNSFPSPNVTSKECSRTVSPIE